MLVPENQDAVLAGERYSGMVRRVPMISCRTCAIRSSRQSMMKSPTMTLVEYLHACHAPSRNAAMREINPTKEELKEKTDKLTARRDELAKNDDVMMYARKRRELRDAEADIADESLGRVLKQEIAALKKMPVIKEYVGAVEKLRALSGVKPFEGDNTALSGMSNAESAKIISEAKKRSQEKALEGVSAWSAGGNPQNTPNVLIGRIEAPMRISTSTKKYEHYVPMHWEEIGGNGARLANISMRT